MTQKGKLFKGQKKMKAIPPNRHGKLATSRKGIHPSIPLLSSPRPPPFTQEGRADRDTALIVFDELQARDSRSRPRQPRRWKPTEEWLALGICGGDKMMHNMELTPSGWGTQKEIASWVFSGDAGRCISFNSFPLHVPLLGNCLLGADSYPIGEIALELSKFINHCNEVKAATLANKDGGQLSIVKVDAPESTIGKH
ncbi:hypothetical protein ACLOJK_015883 [Asimina triloba]